MYVFICIALFNSYAQHYILYFNFTDKKPEPIYIQRLLIKDYGKYWKQIGRELGMDSACLYGIDVKHAMNCNKAVSCCDTMAKKWLEEDNGATYGKLVNAIKMAQIGEMLATHVFTIFND